MRFHGVLPAPFLRFDAKMTNHVSCSRNLRVNAIFRPITSWIVRLGLLLAALIFMASLMLVAGLLLAMWLLRAMWAKLSGRPVQPWVFKMHRSDMWQRAYRASARGGPGKAPLDVIDAEVRDITDVADVEQKRP